MFLKFIKRIFGLLSLFLVVSVNAESLYLCKSYNGGFFWSSVLCSERKATIDRIVTVPDGTSFEHQVQIGNQALGEVAKLTQPQSHGNASQNSNANSPAKTQSECKYLEDRIAYLDSLARQPQSGSMQDWITAERRTARDRQFRIRCR